MDERRGLIARIGSYSPRLLSAVGALAVFGASYAAGACVVVLAAWLLATNTPGDGTLGGSTRFAVFNLGLLAALGGVVYWIVARWLRMPAAARGLAVTRRTVLEAALGLPGGALLVGSVFALAVAFHGDTVAVSPSSERPSGALMLVVLAGMFLGAAWEEVVYRGGLIGVLSEGFSRPIAVLVPAVLFGLGHAGNPGASVVSVLNTVLAGAFFGWIYLGALGPSRGRSLGWCTGLHAGWNYLLGPVLGIPVSGIQPGAHWLDVHSVRTLWSGGSYGLEAGLATTLVLAPLTAWAAWRVLRVRPAA